MAGELLAFSAPKATIFVRTWQARKRERREEMARTEQRNQFMNKAQGR